MEKAKEIIDDLEADVVMYNEHRMNLKHKQNKNGMNQMLNGGDSDVRSVVAHNVHESKCGKTQQGGTSALLYGPLTEQHDFKASGKDPTGLGRRISIVLRGEDGITLSLVCGYNTCASSKKTIRSSYHRRYLLKKEIDTTCPRTRFKEDLLSQLTKWRKMGNV